MRNILFKTWLIGVAFTLILWAYAMTDMIRYFMWALPGYTIESANALIMHLAIIVDVSGVILFLAPTLALCWQIASEKRKEAMAEIELAKLKAQIFGDADQFAIANRPAKKKAQKTARPAAKKAKAKKRK
jgi:hypothetical protein